MENLLFDTNYSSFELMLMKVFAFLLISGLSIYVIWLILTKLLFTKSKHRKEINLRLIFLWSLFTYFILFNVYLFILLYINGIDSMHWTKMNFYPGIIAQLVIFLGLIIFFFIKRHSLLKLINEKSIN